MDHFESIVATLLEAEGYWVRRFFKVNVTMGCLAMVHLVAVYRLTRCPLELWQAQARFGIFDAGTTPYRTRSMVTLHPHSATTDQDAA